GRRIPGAGVVLLRSVEGQDGDAILEMPQHQGTLVRHVSPPSPSASPRLFFFGARRSRGRIRRLFRLPNAEHGDDDVQAFLPVGAQTPASVPSSGSSAMNR